MTQVTEKAQTAKPLPALPVNPGVAPDLAGDGAQLVTETRFMQQYRIAAAAHGGGDIAAVRNGLGQVEIFTVGTDGAVWNFYPDPSSDAGYSAVKTGLVASTVSAGVDGAGRIVVFAANNVILNYVRETGQPGPGRWGAVQAATLPLPPSPTAIARIYTQEIAGALYVGVLTGMKSVSPGTPHAFAYSAWNASPGVFTSTTMTLSSLNCVWSGSSAATAQFCCLDQVFLGYQLATDSITRYPVAAPFTPRSVDTALDGASDSQYFAVLSDGNLYHLTGGGNGPYSWAQVTQGMSLLRVRADRDATGAIHLFALGGNGQVYHLAPEAGGWGTAAPIQTGAALMAVGDDDGGNIELFLVGTAQGTMTHLIRDVQTGDWERSEVQVPTSGQVEAFVSYSTDVTVCDPTGVPMPGAPVRVWASAQTEVTVNGAVYGVGPGTPADLVTSAAGTLSLVQQTNTLGVATLEIDVTGALPPGQSLGVRQSAGVQERLAAVTADELMQAQVSGGGFLLADRYRTPDVTAALAQAFNECMNLADSTEVRLEPGGLAGRAQRPGVGTCARGAAGTLNRIRARPGLAHWQLDFSGGTVAFRELTPQAAGLLLLEKRARHASADGFLDFLGDIGDVVIGIAEGVVSIVDAVITTLGDAVVAAITLVVEGVSYLFDTTVTVVEQAFDLVETIFAQVEVAFGKVFEWLGFLFSWDDILRTKEALAYLVQQYLAFLPLAAGGIQAILDQGIASAEGQVDALFDQLVALVGGSTLGGYAQQNQPGDPGFSSAVSNNVVLNGTLANAQAATFGSPGGGTLGDALLGTLQQLAQTVGNLPEWAQAQQYLQDLGGSPGQIFEQVLSALLRIVQGIVNAVLAGVQAALDALLQLAEAVLAEFQALLTSPWDIPFVTDFYAWLTDGAQLTLLDLVALITAIPSTVLYKAAEGAAPFPDAASVKAFEASFDAQTLLALSGLGGPPANVANVAKAGEADRDGGERAPGEREGQGTARDDGERRLDWRDYAAAAATVAGGIIDGVLDKEPVTGTGTPGGTVKALTEVGLTIAIAGQACSFPWLGRGNSEPPGCGTPDGAEGVLWIFNGTKVLLDVLFFVRYDAFPENDDTTVGPVVTFVWGCGHCVAVGMVSPQLSNLAFAGEVMGLIPELCSLLRLPAVAAATDEESPLVLAGVDWICAPVAAALGLAAV